MHTHHTHHVTVAVMAPERLGRNNVTSWLENTIAVGVTTHSTASDIAESCGVDARELVDNTDLYEITATVITDKRPPLPAPIAKLFKAAREAVRGTDDELDIDTVTFTIDGRVFLFDQWNFRQPDFTSAGGALSDAMEEAASFVADSYALPVTFERPDDVLSQEQRDTLKELRTVLQVGLDDGSLKFVAEKAGARFDPEDVQEQLVHIENVLKEQPC